MPPKKKGNKGGAKGKNNKQQQQEDESPESPSSPIGGGAAGDATVDATTAEIAAAEAAAEAAAAAAIEQAAAEEAALEAAALAGSTTQEQITDSNTPKKSPTALGLDLNNTPGGYAAGIPLPITPRPEEAPPNLTVCRVCGVCDGLLRCGLNSDHLTYIAQQEPIVAQTEPRSPPADT